MWINAEFPSYALEGNFFATGLNMSAKYNPGCDLKVIHTCFLCSSVLSVVH